MKRISPKLNRCLGVCLGAWSMAATLQAQPSIHDISPNGSRLFQAATELTFGITASGANVNPEGITVRLVSTNTAGRIQDVTLTSTTGLTVGGTPAERLVTAPLSLNVVGYAVTITATDTASKTATSQVNFDTLAPSVVIEAEDFNFGNGQWVPEPQTNEYRRAVLLTPATQGVDVRDNYFDAGGSLGNQAYRDAGLFTEPTADTPRAPYIGTGKTDYNIGWFDPGDWGNYTRSYPAGTYYVYYRAASDIGAPSSATLSLVTSDRTQPGQTTTGLGTMEFPSRGWQVYAYSALRRPDGNLATVTLDGTEQTLRLTGVGAHNGNFLALFPVDTAAPTIEEVYPDGAHLIQPTNTMRFVVRSSSATVDPAGIKVTLTYKTTSGQSGTRLVTSTNGLTVGGTGAERTVSLPLQTNVYSYQTMIEATDVNGKVSVANYNFGTADPVFSFEAEDFDYDYGQFINNGAINAYGYAAELAPAVEGVDTHEGDILNGGTAYREPGLHTEITADRLRTQYAAASEPDYNVGWLDNGDWGNYTRNLPAGTFNVYVRAGTGNASPGGITMAEVTGGVGTMEQTTTNVGTFVIPPTGSWTAFTWVPLKTANGALATIEGGRQVTLRMTTTGGHNANFYAFFPADLSVPTITELHPDGTLLIEPTNTMSFKTESAGSTIAPEDISVTLSYRMSNGLTGTTNLTAGAGLTVGGSPASRTVSLPLRTDILEYQATIQVVSGNGNSVEKAFRFGTLPPAYTFEAEDFNYNFGQFINNPPLNAYDRAVLLDLPVEGVDTHEEDPAGGATVYRDPGLHTEQTFDQARSQYVSAGLPDYNVGWYAPGDWGNYTRNLPAGNFYLYARVATDYVPTPSTGLAVAEVVAGADTYDQTLAPLGSVLIPATGGWQSYIWVPVRDAFGNLVEIEGGRQVTLRMTATGFLNANFYAFYPSDPSIPTITEVYPNGAELQQGTNKFSFKVASSAGIDQANVQLKIDGQTVSGLVFQGSPTAWAVNYPNLTANTLHTASITVTANNGLTHTVNTAFDTFDRGAFTVEAEAFNIFGAFFDNPSQADYYLQEAAVDIDYSGTVASGLYDYRNSGLNTEHCFDLVRPWLNDPNANGDYNVGWFDSGFWGNYTRTYPAGRYNIYLRAANFTGTPSYVYAAKVTSDPTQSGQTTAALGSFEIPPTGGAQKYTWAGLKDNDGKLVAVEFNGVATLRLTAGGGNNVNFFILTPAPTTVTLTIARDVAGVRVSFATESGRTYQVERKQSLADAIWQPLGAPVSGDGTVKSVTDSTAAGSGFYRLHIQ